MTSSEPQRIDNKLECPNYHLTVTQNGSFDAPIHCSTCATYLGTWGELELDFIAQGGENGLFEMYDGLIIRKD